MVSSFRSRFKARFSLPLMVSFIRRRTASSASLPHPDDVVLIDHMNDVRQNFLNGFPIGPVHVRAGGLNQFRIGQAAQEFNDGLLVPVLQHVDQAAVANVGDDARGRER